MNACTGNRTAATRGLFHTRPAHQPKGVSRLKSTAASAARGIMEALEQRRLLSSAPHGMTLLDSFSVSADGSSQQSGIVLEDGEVYLVRAIGTVDLRSNDPLEGRADAEYALFDGVNRDRGSGGLDYGLKVTGADNFDPGITDGHFGPFQGGASYDRKVVGTGDYAGFHYEDDHYGDNSGSLTVEIYGPESSGFGLMSFGGGGVRSTVDTLYPPTPIASEPRGLVGMATGAGGDHAPAGGISQDTGVRYFDGALALSHNDLWSNGFGAGFGQSRSWTNFEARYGVDATWGGAWGNGWVVEELPYIHQLNGLANVEVVSSGTSARRFDYEVGEDVLVYPYEERFFGVDRLEYDSTNDLFTLYDPAGNQLEFHGTGSRATAGKLKKLTDAGGNVTEVTYSLGGLPTLVERGGTGAGGSGVDERYVYAYDANDRVETVTLQRDAGGGWQTVRQARYGYYDNADLNTDDDDDGNTGDLKFVEILDADETSVIDTTYYRYYTSGNLVGGLKAVLLPDSWGRIDATWGGTHPADIDVASDGYVDDFADLYFAWDGNGRVQSATVQGAGCTTCTGGFGTYGYSYYGEQNGDTFTTARTDGFEHWYNRTRESFPDSHRKTLYSNRFGQPILDVFQEMSGGSPVNQWPQFSRYDGAGRLTLTAATSALSGYDEDEPDLLEAVGGNYAYMHDAAGLVTTYSYYASTTAGSSTAGGAKGYLEQWSLQRGEGGTAVPQGTLGYFDRTSGSVSIYPLASHTRYRNDNGTGGQTTSHAYTWHSGTVAAESVTTQLPKVTTAQNGPGTGAAADTTIGFFDLYGNNTWTQDAEGYLHYNSFDDATGARTRSIADVDELQTGDFAGLPSGWTTRSGGGVHLKEDYRVDALGRVTKHTHPSGRIDYTVYNDPDQEVRFYPAWQSATGPIGPVHLYRNDRASGFTEQLGYVFDPDYNDPNPLPAEPDGTDPVGELAWGRRVFRNEAGQVTATEGYASTGSGLGEYGIYGNLPDLAAMGAIVSAPGDPGADAGDGRDTNAVSYDMRGRPEKFVDDAGTITRLVRDALGRVTQEWIGTNDSGATHSDPGGSWPNNMVKVETRAYDHGGLGDSNLTSLTRHVDGTSGNDRVSLYDYDWRNRLMLTRNGVEEDIPSGQMRSLEHLYLSYDNLNQVVAQERFGEHLKDENWPMTSGVPDSPAAPYRTHKSTSSYDEQGRIFRQSVFSVTVGTGAVGNSLDTDFWRDRRGSLIKTEQPGGLVAENTFDGAGRQTASYFSDGGGGSTWADASTLAGDTVLEEHHTEYDANSNAIFSTRKLRFHDASGTGALGDASTSPQARISFAASYYDAADRLTDQVDVGTNGGSSYARPSSVPSRSDTVLVSGIEHDAKGRVWKTTDPRGIQSRSEYDNLGRRTKLIEAYVDGTPSDGDDRTTAWKYRDNGQVLKMTAVMPGTGNDQETSYAYAVTTASDSKINSNSILSATTYPDVGGGVQRTETYRVNRQGDRILWSDRNGTVHDYAYDLLGRIESDHASTLGSGVDGTVRKLETSYDDAGRVHLLTSRDGSGGGSTVLNQVERQYNGLGQLTREYQEHAGAVGGTTPSVQYTYSEMSGGNHSRLTTVTYPNGRVLAYGYDLGLDSSISRLSKLTWDTKAVETYAYLGLSTVVVRDRPDANHALTYLKQGLEPVGDAGDQYTGLDRFGRVVDQRWTLKGGGHADRFGYGHDRNGNRLYRENLVNSAFSELYHGGSGYDSLDRLSYFARGTLNGTKDSITGTIARSQDWELDALGNWSKLTDGVDSGGTLVTSVQNRTHDAQNRITGVSSATTPDHSANGEMTLDETGNYLVYDAWGRLVEVNDGTTVISTYAYDAAFRRIEQNGQHLYYSAQWQVLEERNGSGDTTHQYVWSPVYVDAMVLRDRDTNGNGTLDERLYAVHDANFNVTSVIGLDGSSWVVVERYVYDPYGERSVLDDSWGGLSASAFTWLHGHQGGRHDLDAGLAHFRYRDTKTSLGRWVIQDPLDYVDGNNLYALQRNSPVNWTDRSGLLRDPPHRGSPTPTRPVPAAPTARTAAKTVVRRLGPLAYPLLGWEGGTWLGNNVFAPAVLATTPSYYPPLDPLPPRVPAPEPQPAPQPRPEPRIPRRPTIDKDDCPVCSCKYYWMDDWGNISTFTVKYDDKTAAECLAMSKVEDGLVVACACQDASGGDSGRTI